MHSFLVNNMTNLLIDGMLHQFHEENSLLLKTGSAGLFMGRVTNAQLLCHQNPLASPNVVELTNPTDELVIDNAMEHSTVNSKKRDLVVRGKDDVAAVLPTIDADTVGTPLSLPNGSDEYFRVSGTTAITNIAARRPKRRVTLIFTGTAQLTDGSNLKLNGDFTGGADRSISLVCDGTNWIELARSIN